MNRRDFLNATRHGKGWRVALLIFIGFIVLASFIGNRSREAQQGYRQAVQEAEQQRQSGGSPSSSPSTSGSAAVASTSDPGDQMAAIEEQTTFPSEVTRARFRTLLARLAPRCHKPEGRVSDMIVKTQEILKQKGISVSLIEITEELDRSVEVLQGGDAADTCPQVLALYSILRESQGVTGR